MAKLDILVAPDPRLKLHALAVEQVDDSIRQLMDDMLETMYAAPGIGLAAPQVGVAKRVIVVDVANTAAGEPPAPVKLANPEVIWTSDEIISFQEGCLSVPSFYEDVERPAQCRVRGLNEHNEQVEIDADDLLAICLQHEIDHLDGTLFVDHLSRLKRSRILKKLEKLKKQGTFTEEPADANKAPVI